MEEVFGEHLVKHREVPEEEQQRFEE